MNDPIINKLVTVERCLQRITKVYQEAGNNFKQDDTRQDSVILNLQRACEACIDLANIINKQQQTGIPQHSRDSFALLARAGLLPLPLSESLQKMLGLRNIAIHYYQTLNLDIVIHVVEHRLSDFSDFCERIKRL
ncbi:type VII toxin-antitoxin system HepT family RNase toxin [Agarivorans litoreus]|uniref:type VII toxin-antitoxin system HepT family RNase toxin n=1 Tax=Agarivorans litoreus TaxID=1510455 RepID=UPI001C7CE2A4|nr:DUF86 domain-containing protein [Agarivorans litoreus]